MSAGSFSTGDHFLKSGPSWNSKAGSGRSRLNKNFLLRNETFCFPPGLKSLKLLSTEKTGVKNVICSSSMSRRAKYELSKEIFLLPSFFLYSETLTSCMYKYVWCVAQLSLLLLMVHAYEEPVMVTDHLEVLFRY